MIKVYLLVISILIYLQPVAQVLVGKKITDITNLVKTDSTISLLTKSAQIENATTVRIGSVSYKCIFDAQDVITYISTDDEAFSTSESIRVQNSFLELRRKSNGKLGQIIEMPGWGKYLKLESGWNAVFDFRKKIKNKSKIIFFFQRVEE